LPRRRGASGCIRAQRVGPRWHPFWPIGRASLAPEQLLQAREPAVYLLGNSVIDHSSVCDKDHRTIAEMLGAALRRDVVDLSKGGMQLVEYGDIASLLGVRTNVEALVFPLVPDMTDEANWHRTDDIYRHLGYSALSLKPPIRIADLVTLNRPVNIDNELQVFEGRRFGTIKEIQTRYMSKEKAAHTCPEADSVDDTFFRFMHWRQASRSGPSPRFASELQSLHRIATDHGWPVVFVLMPLNADGYGRTGDARVTQRIRQTHTWMIEQLERMGADYLDLTDSAERSAFVDRWCACGHLADDGRHLVAQAIADKLLRTPDFDRRARSSAP